MELVKTGEKQLDMIRRQINRIHSGAKILTARKIEQINALIKAHKETAHEIAVLVNN
jgi:hypothetical protein